MSATEQDTAQVGMFDAPEESAHQEDGSVRLNLPWPPSANHYTTDSVLLPKIVDVVGFLKKQAVVRPPLDEMGKNLWHWLRANTRVMSRPSDKAKAYWQAVRVIVREKRVRRLEGKIEMSMRAFPPDRRKRDLSNLYKVLEDSMQHAGVFADDYQIARHADCERMDQVVRGGLVEVTLRRI